MNNIPENPGTNPHPINEIEVETIEVDFQTPMSLYVLEETTKNENPVVAFGSREKS